MRQWGNRLGRIGLALGIFFLPMVAGPGATGPGRAAAAVGVPATWAHRFGTTTHDHILTLARAGNGGLWVGGYVYSPNASSSDAWLARVDAAGAILWQRLYGGGSSHEVRGIVPLTGGGALVSAYTTAFGAGGSDALLFKVDANGAVLWQRTLGDAGLDLIARILPVGEDFLVVGTKNTGASNNAVWLFRLSGSGVVTWQKALGTSEFGVDLVQATDGSYFLVESSGTSGGFLATVVMKLDADGNVAWQKAYVGDNNSIFTPRTLASAPGGGLVVAGYAGTYPSNIYDGWVLRLDSGGAIVWQKTIGGAGDDQFAAILADGATYRLAGYTESSGAGGRDVWALSLNDSGAILWQRTFGDTGSDSANTAIFADDGGLVIGGTTTSFSAQLTDAWLLKLTGDGYLGNGCALGVPANLPAANAAAAATLVDKPLSVPTSTPALVSIGTTFGIAAMTEQCAGPVLQPVLFLGALQR